MARVLLFLAIFLCTTGFDQGSKEWARGALEPGVREQVVQGFWDWELAQNHGAAFSSLTSVTGGTVLLSLVAGAALVAIGVMAARTRPTQRLRLVALALIGGGTLGNLVDRVLLGSVTDFVRWHAAGFYWPIFNVADAALVIGVGLLCVDSARARRKRAIMAT